MRNYDGGIWRLKWEVIDGVYVGRVVGHANVHGKGATFRDMAKVLADEVSDKLQGGEWTAEWDPPPPSQDADVGSTLDSHVALGWNGRFAAIMPPTDIYASYCATCGSPTGPRTDKRLRIWIEDFANLCGDIGSAPGDLEVYSVELATAISQIPGALDDVSFRPVERLGRGRKQMVEPIAKTTAGLPRPVALRVPPKYGWECSDCGGVCDYTFLSGDSPSYFYLASDVQHRAGAFWLSPQPGALTLCVPTLWWRKHARSPWARGVISHGLGVANPACIDSAPRRRPHTELAMHKRYVRSWLYAQAEAAKSTGEPFVSWA